MSPLELLLYLLALAAGLIPVLAVVGIFVNLIGGQLAREIQWAKVSDGIRGPAASRAAKLKQGAKP